MVHRWRLICWIGIKKRINSVISQKRTVILGDRMSQKIHFLWVLAFKIRNFSFRQLTKSMEVCLTAEKGQFWQLKWSFKNVVFIIWEENIARRLGFKELYVSAWKNYWLGDSYIQYEDGRWWCSAQYAFQAFLWERAQQFFNKGFVRCRISISRFQTCQSLWAHSPE